MGVLLVHTPRLAAAFLVLVGLALSAACGASDDVTAPTGPLARVLHVTHLDTGKPAFRYGTEVRVVFDRDPGEVTLDYAGDPPLYELAARGATRAFILERSPTILTWGVGGVLELEYDPIKPIEEDRPRHTPVLVWSGNGVARPGVIEGGIQIYVGGPVGDALLIPVIDVTRARITGSDGSSWDPATRSEDPMLILEPEPAHPFISGVTYDVVVHLDYVLDPTFAPVIAFEFTAE